MDSRDSARAATSRGIDFNQLTSITSTDGSSTTFGYDNNGNQVRKQDAAGITQYVYNQDNRLVGIALPNGLSNALEYDANGLRTKKTDSSGTTSYLLDGLSVIAQYASDGTRQAWYTQSLARIDEVLSVVNGQGKSWYQTDALGSTYALADRSGNVVARGGYDVFGAPVATSGSASQPFGFTGREHDLDSGLVYARNRYLSVAAGRWDRADPKKMVNGPNVYGYVQANPALYRDPTGQFLELIPAPLVAFFVGFIGGGIGDIVGQAASQIINAVICGAPIPDQVEIDWDEVGIAALISGAVAAAAPLLLITSKFGMGILGATGNILQFLILQRMRGPLVMDGYFWLALAGSAVTGFAAGWLSGTPISRPSQANPSVYWNPWSGELQRPDVAMRMNREIVNKATAAAMQFLRSFATSILANTNFLPQCPSESP